MKKELIVLGLVIVGLVGSGILALEFQTPFSMAAFTMVAGFGVLFIIAPKIKKNDYLLYLGIAVVLTAIVLLKIYNDFHPNGW
ncbi:MAG TPA: hypothetical protein VJA28_01665 [Patescibacteria group bacterium]|nr:hypothetical protein [Patescibacteria group bacterium]